MSRPPIRTPGSAKSRPAPGRCCASSAEEGQKTVRGTVFPATAPTENRSGLIVQGDLTAADGHAERRAALGMVHRNSPGSARRLTLGADKGYDAAGFVADLRQACVTPNVAQKPRYSAIDGRTTRHEGYAFSLKHRKRIKEAFGWAKTVGGMAQTVYRGVERVRSRFVLRRAANNLARLPRLPAA